MKFDEISPETLDQIEICFFEQAENSFNECPMSLRTGTLSRQWFRMGAASALSFKRNLALNSFEMLTALKRCLDMVATDKGPPNWDWIREVIKKAEGK